MTVSDKFLFNKPFFKSFFLFTLFLLIRKARESTNKKITKKESRKK